MKLNTSQQAFFTLMKAGLWEKEALLSEFKSVDYSKVLQLADEQSVPGIVSAGIEHITDVKLPQNIALQFAGESLQLEKRNKEINVFIPWLTSMLHNAGIKALLVKGQGVARCYERPLWRAPGDVDLLLSEKGYEKAKSILCPIAEKIEKENIANQHLGVNIKGFEVELHGKMPFMLSKRIDKEIESVIVQSLYSDEEIWRLDDADVLLPNVDNHVILVFTHFLHHFFIEGVGLRQVCDWCRLLWKYKDLLDLELLSSRLKKMKLMTEWKAFAALAVLYLGMPVDAMPFYKKEKYEKKALLVLNRIMKCGNMGHNNDLSYRVRYKGVTYNIVSLWRRLKEFVSFVPIFPLDAPKFFVRYVFSKTK